MGLRAKPKPTLVDATHGHWPLVSAASVVPSLALAWKYRDELAKDHKWALWLPLPIYFMHQTEEWVKPGGFLPWCNHELLGGDQDEFPITRRVGFLINVGYGWGSVLAAVAAGTKRPAVGISVLASLGGNAAMHIGKAATGRRYNPGTVTSATLLAPFAVAGITSLARDPKVSKRSIARGVAGGVFSAVAMFAPMRLRLKLSKK